MLVKCRLCGTKVDRNEAFKVVVGGKTPTIAMKLNIRKYCTKRK